MTLASDLYTILHAGWDTAIILEPHFLTNETNQPLMRDCILNSEDVGTFSPNVFDGSDDYRNQGFTIVGMEGSEVDCGKCIAQIKKLLKRNSSVTNGTYRLDTYSISRDLQQCRYQLEGSIQKLIQDDAF